MPKRREKPKPENPPSGSIEIVIVIVSILFILLSAVLIVSNLTGFVVADEVRFPKLVSLVLFLFGIALFLLSKVIKKVSSEN